MAVLVLVRLISAGDSLYDASIFLSALNGGPSASAADYATINTAAVVLLVVAASSWVCAVVAFTMWLHRAATNLPALAASELRFTPGWAVGWWFVPLANLVVPLLVMVEMWKASDPNVSATNRASRSRLAAGVTIPIWWAAWLAVLAVSVIGSFFSVAYTNEEKLVLFTLSGVQDLAIAICFALTVVVIQLLEARQARKYSVLESSAQLERGHTTTSTDLSTTVQTAAPSVQAPVVRGPASTYPSPPDMKR